MNCFYLLQFYSRRAYFPCSPQIEKGFNLLYYLEKHLGGPEVFEPYVRAHVQEFAGRSINTDDWKTFLYSFMEKNFGQEKVDLLNKVDWEAWLAGTGMVRVPFIGVDGVDGSAWTNGRLPFARTCISS